MGSGRQAALAPRLAGDRRDRHQAAADSTAEEVRPVSAQAAESTSSSLAESGELARALEARWDQIFDFFARHRATTALVAWAGVSVFDVVDMRMPAEWLVFTFFSFSVFVQAFGMSILLFAALTAAMTVLNIAVYYCLPFSVTSLLSTVVVCMLLVRGVHGLDSKGWAVTGFMSLSRLSTPWCEILPEYLQAPVAAYCASFGLLWIVYHSSGRLEHLLDPLCMLVGVIPPLAPWLSIVEIEDTSIIVSWAKDFHDGSLLTGESETTQTKPGNAHASSSGSPSDSGLQPIPMARSSSNPPVSSTGRTCDSPPSLPGSLVGRKHGPTGHIASTNEPVIKMGRFIAVDRRLLPEACVSRYEVEVNGRIIGACSSTDETTRAQGLRPASTYQIRVWAISTSGGRAPSAPVLVKTLSTHEAQARKNSTLVDINDIHRVAAQARAAVDDMEGAITALKSQTDLECGKLQQEVVNLRAERKEEESTRAELRDQVRELEASKRRLEKLKVDMTGSIAEAAARRQRALDRRLDQARQAEEHRRAAMLVREKMERERRDYEHERAELAATIDTLNLELDKASQRQQDLSKEQAAMATELQRQQAEVLAQEKENAELEAKVKQAAQKRQHIKMTGKDASVTTAKLEAEVESLACQLDEAVARRQQSEITAHWRQSALQNATAMAQPSPIYSAPYSARASGHEGFASPATIHMASHRMGSLSAQPRHADLTPASSSSVDDMDSRHARSTSLVCSPVDTATAAGLSPRFVRESSPGATYSGRQTTDGANGAIVPSRLSADLESLFGSWNRASSGISAGSPLASARIPPLSSDRSAALDAAHIPLASTGATCAPLCSTATPSSSSLALHPIEAGLTRRPESVVLSRGLHRPVGPAPLWEPRLYGSTSTTTAEASALSILRDTDLAYPTPRQPDHNKSQLVGDTSAFASTCSLPPPTSSDLPYRSSIYHPRHPLSSILVKPVDAADSRATALNTRYNSSSSRLSGSGWLDPRYMPQHSSLGSGITARHEVGRAGSGGTISGEGPFLLRTASPAEQPHDLFSGDVLGVHSLPHARAAPPVHRPQVDPIGAPIRRRNRGPSLGTLSTRSHDNLPLSAEQPRLEFRDQPASSTGSASCRTSMDIDRVSSPPADNSLYQNRLFWESNATAWQKKH